jgi:hypothetical protein
MIRMRLHPRQRIRLLRVSRDLQATLRLVLRVPRNLPLSGLQHSQEVLFEDYEVWLRGPRVQVEQRLLHVSRL